MHADLQIELMPQQIFISVKMFIKFHASLKLTLMDVRFNDPKSFLNVLRNNSNQHLLMSI